MRVGLDRPAHEAGIGVVGRFERRDVGEGSHLALIDLHQPTLELTHAQGQAIALAGVAAEVDDDHQAAVVEHRDIGRTADLCRSSAGGQTFDDALYDAIPDPSHAPGQAHTEAALAMEVEGADVDIYLAYLDAVPRITDVVWEIKETDYYDELVVIPMLLADSTHTQEVEELVYEAACLTSNTEVLKTEPFYEIPLMRNHFKNNKLYLVII